jgi:hypothetical protein
MWRGVLLRYAQEMPMIIGFSRVLLRIFASECGNAVAEPVGDFLNSPHLSKQIRAAHQSFDFAPALECHRVISLVKGCQPGDSRLIGRVRFLRAGFVTPLPGGLGIGPAGTMTGARGASL